MHKLIFLAVVVAVVVNLNSVDGIFRFFYYLLSKEENNLLYILKIRIIYSSLFRKSKMIIDKLNRIPLAQEKKPAKFRPDQQKLHYHKKGL